MDFTSIILFLIYTLGLGFASTFFVKNSENFLERNLMRIGIGLGTFLTLGLLLNLLRIPLDWRIFLFLSLVFPIIYLFKNKKISQLRIPKLTITKSNLIIFVMLLIFLVTLYMYEKGAFIYPYLEDDDSWSHAMGVKYVSIEKTVFRQTSVGFHYMDPYPPTYDMFLGVLHQTNNSVYWTLKFFNALIISFSIIFFYFFAKEFMDNKNKALFATFALASVPAFLSHFIWALAITVPLYFVSFYCTERIKYDKKWYIPAAIVIAATLTSSPTHSTYFGLFFIIYFIGRTLIQRKLLIYEFLTGFFGLFLSFILWWLPMILIYGLKNTIEGVGLPISKYGASLILRVGGTADKVYTLSDFIFTEKTNMINNPIGIGVILSILTIIGLIFIIIKHRDMLKKENYYKLIMVLWFIFTLYAVNAARFPIKLSPFRAWMLLAIPVSLLSGEAINLINIFVKAFVKGFTKSNKIIITIVSLAVLGVITYGVVMTSFVQKYTVNTAQWPPGAFWTSNEEIVGYLWLKDNLPVGTKVFTFVNDAPIIAYDKFTCLWCEDINDFKKDGFGRNAGETYDWLKSKNYKYIIIDGQTAKKFGNNETSNKIQDFINSNKFKLIFNNEGMIIFEIF